MLKWQFVIALFICCCVVAVYVTDCVTASRLCVHCCPTDAEDLCQPVRHHATMLSTVICFLSTAQHWGNTTFLFHLNIIIFILLYFSWFKAIWVLKWNGFTTWPPVLGTSCSFWAGNGSVERWHRWYSTKSNSFNCHWVHWSESLVPLLSTNAIIKLCITQ